MIMKISSQPTIKKKTDESIQQEKIDETNHHAREIDHHKNQKLS